MSLECPACDKPAGEDIKYLDSKGGEYWFNGDACQCPHCGASLMVVVGDRDDGYVAAWLEEW